MSTCIVVQHGFGDIDSPRGCKGPPLKADDFAVADVNKKVFALD